ncbi:hypothetical protein CIB95_12570 [Lottiidibacillus patelloidae]|uniref:Uncharacterized protein n=1 Tax=Lottiidibacillus patelloidae TaxID=2670334 RepID=A0A263BRC0_9BACI|nr:hypothetical protein [Lottiidibacillus patelloidae]OZM56251.1 hypothetical protein CIB95_12570 [Lottiidibacillus patelloidae]
MDLTIKWESQFIKKEIQKLAYHIAKELDDSFECKYGSASYFNSLSRRVKEFLEDGISVSRKKLVEESIRGSVAKYWETKNIDGLTLLQLMDELFSERFKLDLITLSMDYDIETRENSPQYSIYYLELAKNVFLFIADFIVLEEKKNGKN